MAVPVRMAVPVIVRAAQNEGAGHVHRQPQQRHGDGLRVADGLRRQQPLQRAGHHQRCHARQQDGAGKARQHFNLPGAEGKARVFGQPARGRVGKGRQANGQHVRTHVPAIGQQRHRASPPARADFQQHGRHRQRQHQARAALGLFLLLAVWVEVVRMRPAREVFGVHVAKPLQMKTADSHGCRPGPAAKGDTSAGACAPETCSMPGPRSQAMVSATSPTPSMPPASASPARTAPTPSGVPV